jgi:hypothetical protein
MTKRGTFLWGVGFLVLGGLIFWSCAASKTYLLRLQYDPAGTPVLVGRFAKPVTVAVYKFQDVRPDQQYLGRRVYRDDMVDFFKSDGGTVDQVVSKSIAKILEAAGFKVTFVNRFLNPEKEDFKDIPADAALGGTIETFWVEAKTGRVTTDTDATLKIQVVWGLPQERTWIKKTISGSAQETDRPFYKPEYAEAKLNEVLKDSLDKFLRDDAELKEKLIKKQ